MPDTAETAERTTTEREDVQMTPTQLNDVIEDRLTNLKPALESVCEEMVRLKDDLANGKFSIKDILKKAKKTLGLV